MMPKDKVVRRKGVRVEPEPCLACGKGMVPYSSRVRGFHQNCEPRFKSTGRLIPNAVARRLYEKGVM